MSSNPRMNKVEELELEKGSLIQDRYRIESALGTGGFAQVFKARDEHLDRSVAIKFLRLDLNNNNEETSREKLLTRFRREAKVTARLDHPNIIDIFDFGIIQAGGAVPFIVMKLLSGQSLRERLDEGGAIGAERTLKLITPCLEGLGKAHKEGIVHKDLTPNNLFLTDVGTRAEALQIFDFGIAHIKSHRGTTRFTAAGKIIGTMRYLPPEYLDSHRITKPFDIYQMALVFVEMLMGRPLVNDSSEKRCIAMHLSGILNYVPEPLLQGELGRVLSRALASEPEQRFQDADAFADALDAIRPSELPPPEALEQDSEASEVQVHDTQPSDEMPFERDDSGPGSQLTVESSSRPDLPPTPEHSGDSKETVALDPVEREPSSSSSGEGGAHAQTRGDDDGARAQTHKDTTADVPPTRTQFEGRRLWGALAFLVLFVVGGVSIWIVLTGGSGTRTGGTRSSSTVATTRGRADVSSGRPSRPDTSEGSSDTREDASRDTSPSVVEVELQSEPTGASILHEGEILGTTPTTIRMQDVNGGNSQTIELRHEDHRTRELELTPDDAPSRSIVLEPVETAERREAPSEPPSRRRDEHSSSTETSSDREGTMDDGADEPSSDSRREATGAPVETPSEGSRAETADEGTASAPGGVEDDTTEASTGPTASSPTDSDDTDPSSDDDSSESSSTDSDEEDRMMLAP